MPLVALNQTTRNPLFNLARQAATVTAPPPFDFSGVVMRFFPLKADFLTLSKFCDQYLNLAPEFAYFRPSMPFVMLSILNYGRMSMEAGNLGWTSQNEVLFSIPIEWYRWQDGEYVYVDQAQVAPFIFVDDEASQVAGREVYGWPKVQGWFASEVNPWATDPRSARQLLRLETRVFEDLYAARRQEPREILSIEEEPPLSFSEVPPDPRNPLNPLVSISKAVASWSDLLRAGVDMWTTLPIRGYDAIDRRTLPNLMASALGSMDVFTGSLQANTINLKQFRDAEDPTQICYQALTNAKMEITQFRRGGLLGDLPLLRGDPSGGYRVQLSRYDSIPIVDTLGLEVSEETKGEGPLVQTLTPVLPFWQEVDLRYLAGERLCWRTRELTWRDDRSVLAPSLDGASSVARQPYNTASSSGVHVATGPFYFPGATVRLLPLFADAGKLQELCDGCLNKDPDTGAPNGVGEFEVVGSDVYLAVTSFGEMSSDTNDIGFWAEERVDFAIPVRWKSKHLREREQEIEYDLARLTPDAAERADLEAELVEVRRKLLATPDSGPVDAEPEQLLKGIDGFFSPFMFAAGGIQVATGREVNGWNTIKADIEAPSSPWLGNAGPFSGVTPLLRLSTEVFPALGAGQASQWRALIEIVDEKPPGYRQLLSQDDWEAADKEFLDNMRLVTMRSEGEPPRPLNQFSLKQFRDAAEPLRACYQAIVRCPTVIEEIHEVRSIDRTVEVRIHHYPTQPIVDLLGLRVKKREITHEGAVDCLEPAHAFCLKGDLRAELGANLCWRAGSDRWEA